MKTLLGPIGCCLVLLATANCISEQCKLYEQTTMMCRCVGNEEFFLPDGYNYENVTSLQIASCNSANLHHSSLISTNRIAEVIVQNISERLIFELYLMSKKLKRLKLSNVGWIPSITQDTFVNLGGIESVWLENTRIDHLEEQFASIAVNDFTMINVTIERIDELNFSEKGNILRIEDSVFRNVTGPLNFADFAIVKILRSEFRLQKPGHVWIESDLVQIKDSIFSNASTNVVATNNIWLHANCADGKSSIRLSSTKIKSVNNRLPTEIVYKGNKSDAEHFVKRNNTVCIAGDCKCPKSNGESTRSAAVFIVTTFVLQFLLPVTLLSSLS